MIEAGRGDEFGERAQRRLVEVKNALRLVADHEGALALSDKDKAWGGADREKLDAAKREAVAHCQTHTTTGTCTVRVSGCNK